MCGTGAAFGGGQGAIAAALTLGLIQDVVHGGEHVPGWDAVHGECCGVVIGDKFPLAMVKPATRARLWWVASIEHRSAQRASTHGVPNSVAR